jgi:iron donor protein CyaY
MTDLEYQDRAERALRAIELACDRINDEGDADIDNQRTGGMITLTFANRSQIIVNLQKPLQEIWLAARAGTTALSPEPGRTPKAPTCFLKPCRVMPVSRPDRWCGSRHPSEHEAWATSQDPGVWFSP